MILLTQNLLISPMAAASQEKPLAIEASEVQEKEREYNEDFLKRMLDRIDWASFLTAAKSVGFQFTWSLCVNFVFAKLCETMTCNTCDMRVMCRAGIRQPYIA
jgi:hypothetical protein